MTETTMVQAINMALARAMAEDDRVLVLGEDVGIDGGVFRATDGLIKRFGADRVRDTPLSEAGIGGIAVGLAVAGFKPVAEIQFTGFIYPVIDQIINHATRFRTRTRGHATCPMIVRAPCGGGIHAPEHHSESPEAMFAHIPGLRVIIPSSPRRAYGLLLAAIRGDDPVVFMEPARLYRSTREQMTDDGEALPVDRCFVLHEGRDVTLVAWGAMVPEALKTASAWEAKGVSAEVIDVATLKPLDSETIVNSVRKTGRCIVVHEAPLTGGFGGEIVARVVEGAFTSLLAPIERVTGFDTVMPLPRLEEFYLPNVSRIGSAVDRAMAYS
ncbi:MAG: alpha-ketoacid dehydrogenase subunit beta [Acetobacteraceae bacterium]|jgi:pyruvate dehydrogenase E1 component beta subunit